mgnify:FL=1
MARLIKYLTEEEAEQLRKWGETFGKNHGIMPGEKGFHKLCVEHMKDNIDDPEAYCARVLDAFHGSTYWRGKDKSKKEIKKDTKAHQNYPEKEK